MSNRKQVLALLTLATLSTASFTAMADSSICHDPLQKICSDTASERAQREIIVKKLKGEIAREAEANAAPRINEALKKIPKFRFIKRILEPVKIRNQEIMKAAKKRVGDIETKVINEQNISKIKNYFYQAIDQSKFDTNTKAQFKSNIKSIVVGNFADFLEKADLENSVLAQMLSNACGSDGLIDNAFATMLKGERYVLVCPGFLINLNQQASDKERFNSVLHALSHEMGHHIDQSKVGPELYTNFLGCISKNYTDSLKRTADDQKFCQDSIAKDPNKDPSKCNDKVALSHAGELIADQWGILITAIHAKAEKFSFGETEEMLTDSWMKLCGTGDEGIHPTGDFRMASMMARNPSITDVLACQTKNNADKAACTFDGEAIQSIDQILGNSGSLGINQGSIIKFKSNRVDSLILN